MTTEVTTFTFAPSLSLRAVTINGEPWFVAKDVCDVLEHSNVSMALADVDPDDKRKESLGLPGRAPLIINESGLYSLILKSRKPEAKAFKKWVTSEVLPSIRDFNGHAFVFREDGWFNMTKAAKHFGKRIQDFWDNKDSKEYILALCKTIHANQRELFMAKAGYNGGTWAHPKLAVFFARWLDVRFAVWCDAVIDDILKGKAEVVITKPDTSAVAALPEEFTVTAKALASQVANLQTELFSMLTASARAASEGTWGGRAWSQQGTRALRFPPWCLCSRA